MGLFNQQTQNEKRMHVSRYNNARINLIFVVVLTVINIVFLATGVDSYFLLSASIPYLLTFFGMYYCGMLPEDYYEGDYDISQFLDPAVFAVLLVISLVIVALYLVFFILSARGRVGWLIAAEVFFVLDTLAMFGFYGLDPSMLIDILLHVYILVSLGIGIHAAFKLKRLSTDMSVITEIPVCDEGEKLDAEDGGNPALVDSIPIRVAATDVKARILLESTVYGHSIIYRRVKKTNELVIDGRVYAEYIALLEKSHLLTACLDGHEYGVGFSSAGAASYLVVDGNLVATKTRFF